MCVLVCMCVKISIYKTTCQVHKVAYAVRQGFQMIVLEKDFLGTTKQWYSVAFAVILLSFFFFSFFVLNTHTQTSTFISSPMESGSSIKLLLLRFKDTKVEVNLEIYGGFLVSFFFFFCHGKSAGDFSFPSNSLSQNTTYIRRACSEIVVGQIQLNLAVFNCFVDKVLQNSGEKCV